VRNFQRAGLLAALVLAASTWFYVQHVMIAHQLADAARHDVPRGNLSDLYPRWLGARELLLHHRDPYSPAITREIQMGYYGRSLDPARSNDPKDQQAFAYPLYVVFFLAPTIMLPFSLVQTGFFWLLMVVTISALLLWLRILRWHPSHFVVLTMMALTLGSFQILQGLKLQQLTLLVAALIAASVALLATGHLVLSGILLAIAAIKPQLILFLAAWLLLWASSDWARRKNLVLAFGGTLILEVLGAECLLPGWIQQFREAIANYRQYNDGALSILQVLISPLWGSALALLILLATARLCWKVRQVHADSTAFTWTTVLVLAITILVIPKTSPYNQTLLLPGVLLIAQNWRIALGKTWVGRLIFLVSALIFFWPWLAALAITIIVMVSPGAAVSKLWVAPVYTMLAIPGAICLLLAFSLRGCASQVQSPRIQPSPTP
jgi:hypothetical protein